MGDIIRRPLPKEYTLVVENPDEFSREIELRAGDC